MKDKKHAEFQLQDLLPVAMVFVVTGIGIAFGINIMGDVKGDFVTGDAGCNATAKGSCGVDYNATEDAVDGVAKLAEKLPLIATVVVAAILIGILVRYLFVKFV